MSEIQFEKLLCNQVKMDMFDKLEEKGKSYVVIIIGIVANDIIRKTFEDRIEEVEICD